MVLEILKNIETVSVSWLLIKAKEIIKYVKENRVKRPMSSMNKSALSRRKSYGMKSNIKSRKSQNNLGIDYTIVSKKVKFK